VISITIPYLVTFHPSRVTNENPTVDKKPSKRRSGVLKDL
jgi:hypothetical protein